MKKKLCLIFAVIFILICVVPIFVAGASDIDEQSGSDDIVQEEIIYLTKKALGTENATKLAKMLRKDGGYDILRKHSRELRDLYNDTVESLAETSNTITAYRIVSEAIKDAKTLFEPEIRIKVTFGDSNIGYDAATGTFNFTFAYVVEYGGDSVKGTTNTISVVSSCYGNAGQTPEPSESPLSPSLPEIDSCREDVDFSFKVDENLYVVWLSDNTPAQGSPGFIPMGDIAMGEPSADDSNSSPDLGDFLESIEVFDGNGNPVTEESFRPGDKYNFRMKFHELPEQEKIFRPATEEELKALDLSEEEIEGGPWMYVELGDDVDVENGTESADGKVRVVGDGKYLLVKYEGDETHQMDSCEVNFSGTLNEGDHSDGDGFHILEGSESTWNPQPATDPYVQKSAKYNPETQHIEYTVRVCNPGSEELTNITLEDLFTDSEEGSMPELVPGSVKFGQTELPDEQIVSEDGHLSFSGIGPVPPDSCVELTY